MISYVQPQLWKGHVLTNTDRVIAAIPIPRGGVFHGMNLDVSLRGLEQLVLLEAMYAISAYIVPIPDPEGGATFQGLWDSQIPKAAASGAGNLDLDTGGNDVNPEYNPGEVNWAGVFDMESGPTLLYRKRSLVRSTESGTGKAATGTFTHYIPQARVQINLSGGQRAKVPSCVMVAVSSPAMDVTTSTTILIPTENEWTQLQYLEDTALNALRFLIGRVASGTQETASEDAAFLAKTLAPPPFEETGAEFTTITWEVTAHGKFTMSVPGTMQVRKLDGDR